MTEDAHPQDIEGTTSPPEQTQTGASGGDRGPARSTETDERVAGDDNLPHGSKQAQEADPVLGGSGSIGRERLPSEDDDGPFGE